MNCEICTEPYTKRRQNIKCQYCEFAACTNCYKTYLLGINKPKCMSNECDGEWSRKHLRENFTQVFIDKELREHQKNVLVETQMALMPETQLIIEERKRVSALNMKIDELMILRKETQQKYAVHEETIIGEYNKKRKALADMNSWHTNYYGNLFMNQLEPAFNAYNNDNNKIADDGLRETMSLLIKNYEKLKEQVAANSITIELNKNPEWGEYAKKRDAELNKIQNDINKLRSERDNGVVKTRTEFIRKCGDPECRGFLSTRWKCGICEKTTCNDCHEVKQNDVPHVCDSNIVETIKLLKTDTKNCPNCQASIFKIDGCDQMWCTQCKTGFSWTTGRIELKLHNPHYYEWRRQNGGLEREPGDNQQCVTPHDLAILIMASHLSDDIKTKLVEKCRRCIHISAYNTNPIIPNYENYRIQYLNQSIDMETFKSLLIRMNKAYSKKNEQYTVYELFITTFTDIMRRFCAGFTDFKILDELDTITSYVNGCLADIGYSYGCTTKHVIGGDLIIRKVSMKS